MDTLALAPLLTFRTALAGCFGRRRDALFELVDALLTADDRSSLARLSLTPLHRRKWGSVYAALRRGQVQAEALRDLLARQVALAGPLTFAVDVSIWPRPDAETSPERGYQYFPAAASQQPVVGGWAYQWIAQLSPTRDSWTAPVDVRRVTLTTKPTLLAMDQITALVARLPPAALAAGSPLFVFDAGYDVAFFAQALADVPAVLLIRLRSNRCFYFEPDPATQPKTGRPKRHGAKFVCNDSATWPEPTVALHSDDEDYGQVDVRAWAGLHSVIRRPVRPGVIGQHRGPRLHAQGTVLRVELERLPGRQRKPAILWLWWQGPAGQEAPTVTDLERCWKAYARRYDLEQTFRFLKQTLGWVMPHVRLPEQADRWSWLVAAAYTQLRLARDAVADQRLPWERALPASRLSPGRVRRGFATLAGRLPTVTATPNPAGRSPGRPKGRRSQPAARYPPRKKAA
jgi:hypothetical protein